MAGDNSADMKTRKGWMSYSIRDLVFCIIFVSIMLAWWRDHSLLLDEIDLYASRYSYIKARWCVDLDGEIVTTKQGFTMQKNGYPKYVVDFVNGSVTESK